MSVIGKRIHDIEHVAETLLLSLGLMFAPVGAPSSVEETEAFEGEPEVGEDISSCNPSSISSMGQIARASLIRSSIDQHVRTALDLIIPKGDHELKEKEELAEAFIEIIEAKGRERGLREEDIEGLREHLRSATGRSLSPLR